MGTHTLKRGIFWHNLQTASNATVGNFSLICLLEGDGERITGFG